MMEFKQDSLTPRIDNAATRTVVSTLGVLVGIGSIDHGLLETLQGYRPTPGLIVNALGAGYRWTVWKEGGEAAFTLVPNFLVTGIVATLLGLLMILWALRFIQTKHGPVVFLLLGMASFFTGGASRRSSSSPSFGDWAHASAHRSHSGAGSFRGRRGRSWIVYGHGPWRRLPFSSSRLWRLRSLATFPASSAR